MDKQLLEIINLIVNWQKENDEDFKPIPIDEHYYIELNNKNNIFTFIFSNKRLRDKCKSFITINAMNYFTYIHEDDKRFTYFKI